MDKNGYNIIDFQLLGGGQNPQTPILAINLHACFWGLDLVLSE